VALAVGQVVVAHPAPCAVAVAVVQVVTPFPDFSLPVQLVPRKSSLWERADPAEQPAPPIAQVAKPALVVAHLHSAAWF
jgi:hypothetical protein